MRFSLKFHDWSIQFDSTPRILWPIIAAMVSLVIVKHSNAGNLRQDYEFIPPTYLQVSSLTMIVCKANPFKVMPIRWLREVQLTLSHQAVIRTTQHVCWLSSKPDWRWRKDLSCNFQELPSWRNYSNLDLASDGLVFRCVRLLNRHRVSSQSWYRHYF